jgi:hypothetical protein
MIDALDEMLRDLIQSRVAGLAGLTQVGFAPPNADWKGAVAGENRVNLYLYDVREDVRLRSNERVRTSRAGWFTETLASPRLDCAYLVTAWSPITGGGILTAATVEHELLYAVLAVLMQFRPLVAAEVYARPNPFGHTLAGVPDALKAQPLPAQVALPDAVREPAEFWTTMNVDSRPALHLVVTIPVVVEEPDVESPMVTTLTGRYGQTDVAVAAETTVSVGGHVRAGAGGLAVGGAWVQLVGVAPPDVTSVRRRVITGADGRFLFSALRPGAYQLRAVKPGIGDVTRAVDVPSASGEYDVQLP